MEDMGDTPHSDSDRDEDEGSDFSDDPSQPTTDLVNNDADRLIDELVRHESDSNTSLRYCGMTIRFLWCWLMLILMGLTIGHSLYWFIFVFIGLCAYCIDAIRNPRWTYDHRFRVSLGQTRPWLGNFIRGANHTAQPSDSLLPITITFTFSTTVTEYVPVPQENTITTNNQLDNIFISIILNNLGQDHRSDDNETTRSELCDVLPASESTISDTIIDNDISRISTEISHDTEFADDSDSSSDDERLLPGSFPYADSDENDDHDVISNSHAIGEASPRTELIVDIIQDDILSNQTDLPNEPTSTIDADSSPSQTPRCVQGVDAPAEGDSSRILAEANPMIINQIKVPTPGHSSEESGEENNI